MIELVPVCNAGRACCITVRLEPTLMTSDFSRVQFEPAGSHPLVNPRQTQLVGQFGESSKPVTNYNWETSCRLGGAEQSVDVKLSSGSSTSFFGACWRDICTAATTMWWSVFEAHSALRYTLQDVNRRLSRVMMWSISFSVTPSLDIQVMRWVRRRLNQDPSTARLREAQNASRRVVLSLAVPDP